MNWWRHKRRVERLARRASAKAHESVRLRTALKQWAQAKLGRPETLAWTFAAGAWWSASKDPAPGRPRPQRLIVGLFNATWLAWRALNSPVVSLADDAAGMPVRRGGRR